MANVIGMIVGFVLIVRGTKLTAGILHNKPEKEKAIPLMLLATIFLCLGIAIVMDAVNTLQILDNVRTHPGLL